MQPDSQMSEPSEVNAEDMQELYVDAMQIHSGLYTAILTFGDLRQDEPTLNRVRLRVSPHMLKAISLLTAKHVRDFERQTGGPILLPNELVHQWGLEEEIR